MKNGVKFMRYRYGQSKQGNKGKPAVKKLCLAGSVTKCSQRTPLYVFPHFDKCDSLLFFPSALARHLNCDDMHAAKKLVITHLTDDCDIRIDICPGRRFDVKTLLKVTQLQNELQPDRIMCVHSTKVIENQIRSTVYFKFTECKSITEGVERENEDPQLQDCVFHTERSDRLKKRVFEAGLSEQETQRQCALIDTNQDLLIYVTLDFVITFDDLTKKVTNLDMSGRLTSMHLA